MNSVWVSSPPWISMTPLLKRGNEMLGVVIRSGKMNKTVTVKVKWQVWNKKYGTYYKRTRKYLVHDEEDYCRAGDIVVIKSCRKVSNRKAFFIRNIVRQAGRFDYWESMIKQREIELKDLTKSSLESIKEENKDTLSRAKTQRDRAEIMRELKLKAMTKAFTSIRDKDHKKDEELGFSRDENVALREDNEPRQTRGRRTPSK